MVCVNESSEKNIKIIVLSFIEIGLVRKAKALHTYGWIDGWIDGRTHAFIVSLPRD